jgi:hypothetical protein
MNYIYGFITNKLKYAKKGKIAFIWTPFNSMKPLTPFLFVIADILFVISYHMVHVENMKNFETHYILGRNARNFEDL